MSLSIIIPALNEAANLSHVLPRIPQLPGIAEVVLVNGASSDGTAEVARAQLPTIRIVDRDDRGRGNAVRYGARVAVGEYFLVLDADGSHGPEEIPWGVKERLASFRDSVLARS